MSLLKSLSRMKKRKRQVDFLRERQVLQQNLINLEVLHEGSNKSEQTTLPFRSESCASHHFYLEAFGFWCEKIREKPRWHRKQWEFVYVAQSLWERGLLTAGRKGLGFGVGKEPLSALFASYGVAITATDMDTEGAIQSGWATTSQHASALSDLNDRGICSEDVFKELVSFRFCDMNHIDEDLNGYDFCWSAENSLETLRPGGFAIHTTELNLSSNEGTLDKGATVLFRRRDLEALIQKLETKGHKVEPLLVHQGSNPIDNFVDLPPYFDSPHLRLRISSYVTTSVGVIVQKAV
jgi:hypothetical protein